MKSRSLGTDGPKISPIGLGCMGMSEFYGQRNDNESINVLNRAFDLGINFYDTADMYGSGHNEKLLSKFIKDKRENLVIATKFGIKRNPTIESDRIIDNSPEYIKKACDNSLKRLGIDYIDIYYLHRYSGSVPIEEVIGTLDALKQAGKIKAIGLSEVSANTIKKAHACSPISAVQTEYSLWCRDIEQNNVLKTCKELSLSLVAYSPLGRGFLTGSITSKDSLDKNDYRNQVEPRFQGENFTQNIKLVDFIKKMSVKKSCKPSQIAISWLLAQGNNVIPIPGTKRIKYLEENIGSLKVELSSIELKELDDFFF